MQEFDKVTYTPEGLVMFLVEMLLGSDSETIDGHLIDDVQAPQLASLPHVEITSCSGC